MKSNLPILLTALCLVSCNGSQRATKTFSVNSITLTLSVTQLPGNSVAGSAHQVSVKILGPSGNVHTAYNGRIKLSSSDLQAVLPAEYVLRDSDKGEHVFSGIIFKTSGPQTLSIRDSTELSSEIVQNLNISPAAPTQLSFGTQPSASALAGINFAVQPQLQVRDTFGNLASSAAIAFSFGAFTNANCSTQATGNLSATLNKDNPQTGVNSFSNLNYTRAENIYLGVSAIGFTPICSTVTTVSPGLANRLVISTQPSANSIAGVDLAQGPVASVQDSFGNLVTSAAVPIVLNAYSDVACSVLGAGIFNATAKTVNSAGGVSSFSGVNYSVAGSVFFGVSSIGLTSACSNAVNIAPAAASQLAISTQPSATATAGVNLASQPRITLLDAFGNTATTSTNTISLTAFSNNTCTQSLNTTVQATANPLAAAAGIAAFSNVNLRLSGVIYIGASSTGLISACSTAVNVSPGAATTLSYNMQPSGAAVAGSAFASQPRLNVSDAFGNLATNSQDAVSLRAYANNTCTQASTVNLSGSQLSVSPMVGVVTFSGVNHTRAETIYVGAVLQNQMRACSNAVAVSHAAASRLSFSRQPSSSVQVNTVLAVQPQVTVFDAFDNVTTGSASSVTLAAFRDAACTNPATGVLTVTTNPANTSMGIANYAGVRYSVAENIYLGVTSGTLTRACSNLVAVTAAPSNNGTAILAWDANTETNLVGYRVYYGTSAGNYNNMVDVGNVTTYTVTSLASGSTYFFAVSAYNTSGLESGKSNEANKAIP